MPRSRPSMPPRKPKVWTAYPRLPSREGFFRASSLPAVAALSSMCIRPEIGRTVISSGRQRCSVEMISPRALARRKYHPRKAKTRKTSLSTNLGIHVQIKKRPSIEASGMSMPQRLSTATLTFIRGPSLTPHRGTIEVSVQRSPQARAIVSCIRSQGFPKAMGQRSQITKDGVVQLRCRSTTSPRQ